jgi:hypothetical protein
MEERIRAPGELVENLQQGERDASAAIWRLRFPLSALEETRLQLAQRAETKNGCADVLMTRLLGNNDCGRSVQRSVRACRSDLP